MSVRYLIIGASGFIGTRFRRHLGVSAVATYHNHPFEGGIRFDVTRDKLFNSVLRNNPGIAHAIILHGITHIDACARDPERTQLANVISTNRIIDELADNHIKPIFFSSDAVFDGSCGNRTELDAASPILTYGRQKLAVEEYLTCMAIPHLTLRLSKVVTTEPHGGDMLSDWMDKLERGTEIRCASDQIFSPVHVADVVRATLELAESGCSGLFHVCCPEPVSRLNLLQMLAAETRKYLDTGSRIISCSIRDFDFLEPRPLDTSMSPGKLYATLGRRFDDLHRICHEAAVRRFGLSGAT